MQCHHGSVFALALYWCRNALGTKKVKAVYQVSKLPIYASLTLTKARAGLPFMIPASKAGEVKFHLLYI